MNAPYIRLREGVELLPFDCGDKDLNEFFTKDAINYQRGLFAVTYYLENDEETILYFTLSNDKLSAIETTKSFWRKVKDSIPHEKHRKDFPAVKIGRFAVGKKFQQSDAHWGTITLKFIKRWMVSENKTGCRFITVDAYKNAVPFYKKNNFKFMGKEEEERYLSDIKSPESEGTYSMYFDLSRINSD